MIHQGLREFSGEESGNVALGQLGFKVLKGGVTVTSGDGNFVAFKVLGGASDVDVDIDCTVYQGEALSIDNVLTGEMVWGAFKKISISNIGTGILVLCYYGK